MKINIIEEYIEITQKIHRVRDFENQLENQTDILAEDEEKYTYTNNSNDKIMRQILKDKRQAALNLNEWLKIEEENKIKPEDLEEVTESYITKTWSNEEIDILYKDKKYDGIYYLIEHQTKIEEVDYIASYIVKRVSIECGKEKAKLMIKNIEKEYEEDDEDMLDEFVDRLLYEGKKLGLREGKKEGRKEGKIIAKKLIKK